MNPEDPGWAPGDGPAGREPWTAPADVLIFPAGEPIGDDPPQLELRRAPDGRLVALAFTQPDRLVALLGRHQRWLAVHRTDVPRLLEGSGAEHVLVDGHLGEAAVDRGPGAPDAGSTGAAG